MIAAVLALLVGLPETLVLHLPAAPVQSGSTLFARAEVVPPPSPGTTISAEASWLGRTYRLHPEAGGGIPVLLAVPLDPDASAPLVVVARTASGDTLRAEARVRLAQRPAPRGRPFDLAPEVAALAGAESARSEADLLGSLLARAERAGRSWTGSFAPPVRAAVKGELGALRAIPGGAAGGEEAPVHRGVDYALRLNASVAAPAAGVVLTDFDWPLLGRGVLVDHGQGVASLFAHLEEALVRPGDRVRRGSVVGWAGSTGLADGVMLHYALFVHGDPVDPAAWEDLPGWLEKPAPEAVPETIPEEASTASGPAPPPPVDAPGASAPPEQAPPAAEPAAAATAIEPPRIAAPAPMPTPSATPPPGPRPSPTPPSAPPEPEEPIPADFPEEELLPRLRQALRARLPRTVADVEAGTKGRRSDAVSITVVFSDLGGTSFFRAVETTSLLVGELSAKTRGRTGRLTVRSAATGQSVTLATRDARKQWRERMGLRGPGAEAH